MRHLKPIKAFITAYRKGRTLEQNRRAFNDLAADLAVMDGVESFRDVEGYFDGQHEEAYICFLNPVAYANATNGGDIVEELQRLGAAYNQDTVLIVWGDDAAELFECNPPRDSLLLGTFQRVAETALQAHESYTRDPIDGAHYVVR